MLGLIFGASLESGGLEWERPVPRISRRDSGRTGGGCGNHSCAVKLESPALHRNCVARKRGRVGQHAAMSGPATAGSRLGAALGLALATSSSLGWHST